MRKMTENKAIKEYNDYLDELGLDCFILPSTSSILKEIDPTQYDCGFNDWCDAEEIELED